MSRFQRSGVAAIAIAVAGVAILAGSAAGSSRSSAGKAKTGIIKYGLISAFSGSTASWGVAEKAAVQLGIADVNRTGIKVGDTTYKFQLYTYDSAYDPTKALSAAEKAVTRDHIGFLENLGAGTVDAVQPFTDRKDVLLICACGGDTFLGTKHPLTFRPYYDVPSSLKASLAYLKKTMPNAKRLSMIYPDDVAGHTNATRSIQYAKSLGFDATMNYIDRSTTDLAPLMTKIETQHPDAIDVGPSPEGLYTAAVQAGQQLGIVAPYIFPDTMDFGPLAQAVGKKVLEGSLSSPCNLTASSTIAKTFQKNFQKLAGPIQWWAAQNYDGVRLLALAIKKAQSLDPKKVAAVLPTVQVQGATGGGGLVSYSTKVGGLPRGFSVPYPVCKVVNGALKQVTTGH